MIRSARACAEPFLWPSQMVAQPSVAMAVVALLLLMSAEAVAARPLRSDDIELARCISETSRGKKWIERTLWGLRDQEGGWPGAEVPNANGSHDLGPLQINSWWVPKLAAATGHPATHLRWWLTHDTCFNVRVALWIFLSGLNITHDYWKAVGLYHSPSEWRQQRYIGGVVAKLRRRFGSRIFETIASQQNGRGQTTSPD